MNSTWLTSFLVLCHATSIVALTHQYFAVGSNVLPNTMTCLRNLRPVTSSAAVLPGYRLAFNIRGNPLLEPSAASAVKSRTDCIHGALYELTDGDFRRLSQSEGVPFVYRWENCKVYRYIGDNDSAGDNAIALDTNSVNAKVLVPQFLASSNTFIPPSSSYLRIIQDGAAYWKLDRSYRDYLADVETAKNLLVPDGLSGRLLKTAELLNPRFL